jgi:xanthine dehydrogenase accessory factor
MQPHSTLQDLKILVRGAGEMASGIAHRLVRSHFRVAMSEIERPLAVRRRVSFCEAVWDGHCEVEGLRATRVERPAEFPGVIARGEIPVLVDPPCACLEAWRPHVVIDATVAKRNLGTRRDMAELVIGFGPGFEAGRDVDLVVETNRGHDLGRLIATGCAAPNTGVPGVIGGYTHERVLRAPAAGEFAAAVEIGDRVQPDQCLARVAGVEVRSALAGVVRGLLRSGVQVHPGLKVGDVDPRGERVFCHTISEKSRALGGSALEAILMRFNS